MSIKRIIAFVLLILLAYFGVYMVIYGYERYMLYSGPERDLDFMAGSELQPKLNVKGSVETVTKLLYTENVSSNIFGIPVGSAKRYYYAMPIGYREDSSTQQYCVIAVSDPDDVAAVEKLMKNEPAPLDPNAPRFEFRGISLDTPTEVYQSFKDYLQKYYYVPEVNFYFYPNVDDNLIPYTIFVKGKNEDSLLTPIIIGGVCAVLGVGLFVLLAIRTYKKKHMYD